MANTQFGRSTQRWRGYAVHYLTLQNSDKWGTFFLNKKAPDSRHWQNERQKLRANIGMKRTVCPIPEAILNEKK